MHQFDIFIFDKAAPCQWAIPFEDSALGWHHDSDWNRPLQDIHAEWLVFTHPAITIDRGFLDNLAQVIEEFPMVDAFAPRIKSGSHFYGGLLLDGTKGFNPIAEDEKMRFVAAPNPLIGVFSSRIVQRTGLFDLTLPGEFRLTDYTLRMAHAGGKMFSVPYLVAESNNTSAIDILDGHFLYREQSVAPLWNIYYKSLSASLLTGFTLRHPSMLPKFFGFDKESKLRKKIRDKATSLSKFSAEYLKEVSR